MTFRRRWTPKTTTCRSEAGSGTAGPQAVKETTWLIPRQHLLFRRPAARGPAGRCQSFRLSPDLPAVGLAHFISM
jgi:hypothetical protein